MLCPKGSFFGYEPLGKYGRVTRVFNQLDSNDYLNSVASFKAAPDRFASHVRQEALAERNPTPNIELAERLLGELTRPDDTILLFKDRRVMSTIDPKTKLAELFDHDVERYFATMAPTTARARSSYNGSFTDPGGPEKGKGLSTQGHSQKFRPQAPTYAHRQ